MVPTGPNMPRISSEQGSVCKGSEKPEQILRTQVEIGELKAQKDTLERIRKRELEKRELEKREGAVNTSLLGWLPGSHHLKRSGLL